MRRDASRPDHTRAGRARAATKRLTARPMRAILTVLFCNSTVRLHMIDRRGDPRARARAAGRAARAGAPRCCELREQLQGSLFSRYGSAARRAAPAARGRKHGPYYVLSHAQRRPGRLLLPRRARRRARGARARGALPRVPAGLRRLQRLNCELVACSPLPERACARTGRPRLRRRPRRQRIRSIVIPCYAVGLSVS